MVRTLLKQIREYKRSSILSIVFTALEAILELIFPTLMALLIDEGIEKGDLGNVWFYGALMLLAAVLSLCGGSLAGICAAVLFCQLTGTVTRYDHQLMKLRSDSSVRGYLTDIRGQSTSGLALGDGVVEGISQIPGVTDVTYLTTTPYYFNGFYRDGKFAGGPGRRAQPIGSFAAERYEDELRAGPKLVFTNSLKLSLIHI